MMKRTLGTIAALTTALLMIGATGASAAAPETVKISGRAYVFNHMNTYISGATIKVREFPKISTVTDELGDYVLKVPNDRNVTPYILSGDGLLTQHTSPTDDTPSGQVQTHWNEVDLQTFHTRGRDLVNANFQTPGDAEFEGLKAILSVPDREDGRPEQCAIVTTASDRNTRGVDYPTFWANTFGGHGVPGATALAYPSLGNPVYFNEFVIPDVSKTETSDDGGIVWSVVPTGTYRIVTSAPGTRFASFLATCAPGRVINANPPWGAYQLNPGEKPLAASNVAGNVISAKATRKGKVGRYGTVVIKAGENLNAAVSIRAGGSGWTKTLKLKPGTHKVNVNVDFRNKWKRATMVVKLKDASGVAFTTKKKIFFKRR